MANGTTLTWDEAKREATLTARGLDFADLRDFDFSSALTFADERRAYGEQRYVAFGPLHGRLIVVVYTIRGDALRIISMRKANAREQKRYAR